jgi:hypothetical protein
MPSSRSHSALGLAVIFVAIFLLHVPLLQLPYFWDEAGYYVPAARDLLLGGSLIPYSAPSNAHPPLVMAWLALWWKLAGYAPLVTRSAMLLVSAFSLLGVFRLAEKVANLPVAIASTLCTALYPVFFVQSSLAQVDLAAAGLTIWGLHAYLDNKKARAAIWFSFAALTKETAILAPAALAVWEMLGWVASRWIAPKKIRGLWVSEHRTPARVAWLLFPLLPLGAWYAYHYARTGYVFGNPEFFRYNVAATLDPLRFVLALGLRLWQVFGYMHLWLLTLGMLLAMTLPPIQDGEVERRRISIPVQAVFMVVVAAYVAFMSLIGGAMLARYMLTAVPLVIILAVSTLRRRLLYWPVAVGAVAAAFVLAWFWNPPYRFPLEDNLAYRDYIVLHEDADRFVEARYPMARVLTAWPAADELTRPWLGYTTRPMQVVRIEDFSLEQVLSAAEFRGNYEVALVFSTKYEPQNSSLLLRVLSRWPKLEAWQRELFNYHRDLPPGAIAQMLAGKIVFEDTKNGQWAAVIEMENREIRDARNLLP